MFCPCEEKQNPGTTPVFSLSHAEKIIFEDIVLRLPYPRVEKKDPLFLTAVEFNRILHYFAEKANKPAGLRNLIIIMLMGLYISSITRICYLGFAYTRLLSPFTVESCPENLVREFGFLGGKRFYSVVAQENPHLNDSELREVEKLKVAQVPELTGPPFSGFNKTICREKSKGFLGENVIPDFPFQRLPNLWSFGKRNDRQVRQDRGISENSELCGGLARRRSFSLCF